MIPEEKLNEFMEEIDTESINEKVYELFQIKVVFTMDHTIKKVRHAFEDP